MNRTFKITGLAACLLAVLLAIGGHWLVLQSVAWTRMVIAYSRDASLAEAVGKTFDGKHPCSMCLKIQEGRRQEKRTPPLVKWEKPPELWLDARAVSAPAPDLRDSEPTAFQSGLHSDFVPTPPKPPPRAV